MYQMRYSGRCVGSRAVAWRTCGRHGKFEVHLVRALCDDYPVEHRDAGLVIWDVDGTLIPADLRWLRRSIARTYGIDEAAVTFPEKKVHGYTDESIVIDTAISSGIASAEAEAGVPRFHQV